MIYIQSDSDRKLPHHFDAACALYGAKDLELPYRLTSFEEVANGKFDALLRSHLFLGSTEFMREVFSRMGMKNVGVPRNSDRTHQAITLGDARKRALSGEKLFIKPFEIKLFTGFILDQMQYTCISDIPDDTMVMAYEPFPTSILTEWRVYVHDGKVVDARNYSGDFMVQPDYTHVKKIIADNGREFPVAYTMDVGILEGGDSVVIEFNDMWAIGNYGIPNDIYLRMLRDRYFEIIRG